MRQVALDMVDGVCCSQCGVYFQEENGFPVLCWDCWKNVPKNQIKHSCGTQITHSGLQRSLYPEIQLPKES